MVMFYHFTVWLEGENFLSATVLKPLQLLGLYAVATFYCISGVALFLVYRTEKINRHFLYNFFIKRSLRICPLFWVATTISIAAAGFTALNTEFGSVILCYTLLFSWLEPTAYYTTGAWSIGNEWAFYTLFPLLLVLWKTTWLRISVCMTTLGFASYYAFYAIKPDLSIAEQWAMYISPLNQLVFFVGGILVAFLILKKHAYKKFNRLLFYLSISLFMTISYLFESGTYIHGFVRFTLIFVCIVWCYLACFFEIKNGLTRSTLKWLGSRSYAIYLLHPIAFGVSKRIINYSESYLLSVSFNILFSTLVASIVLTLTASELSYKFLEAPFIKLGKKLTKKNSFIPNKKFPSRSVCHKKSLL